MLRNKQITYEEVTKNTTVRIDEVDVETAGFYACMDADYTLQLGDIFEAKILFKRKIAELFSVEMDVLKALLAMERVGVKINVDYLKQIEPVYLERIGNLQKKIWEQIGEVNLNSNKQLADRLFRQMKFPVIKATTKGGQSVDVYVLEELKRRTQHPVFDLLIQYRSEEKCTGRTLKGFSATSMRTHECTHPSGSV